MQKCAVAKVPFFSICWPLLSCIIPALFATLFGMPSLHLLTFFIFFIYIYIYGTHSISTYMYNSWVLWAVYYTVSCYTHMYLGRWVSSTVLTKIIVSRSRAILPWGRSRYAHVWELKAYMHVLHQKPYLWTVFSETWGFQNVLLYTSWWQQCHPEQEEGVGPPGGSHTYHYVQKQIPSPHTFTTCTCTLGKILV